MAAKANTKSKDSTQVSKKVANKKITKDAKNLFYRIRETKKQLIPVKPKKIINRKWGGKKYALKKKFMVRRKIRKSIEVGKVAIILAGTHMGKRCIITKILDSGLVVVMNPLEEMNIQLTRMDPVYLIVTSTNVFHMLKSKSIEEELKKKMETINDDSFITSRDIKKKVRKLLKTAGEKPNLFMNTFEDQLKEIKEQNPKGKTLLKVYTEIEKLIKPEIEKDEVFSAYLKTKFTMRTGMSLHKMKF